MSEIERIPNDVEQLYADIRVILANARKRTYHAINFTMVESYWMIGQTIVEHEQHGEVRAAYGKGVLKDLAARLTSDFGKGFDERELRKMRQFYLTFQIRDTLRPELTWSHYRRLISVENEQARLWYMKTSDRWTAIFACLRHSIATRMIIPLWVLFFVPKRVRQS